MFRRATGTQEGLVMWLILLFLRLPGWSFHTNIFIVLKLILLTQVSLPFLCPEFFPLLSIHSSGWSSSLVHEGTPDHSSPKQSRSLSVCLTLKPLYTLTSGLPVLTYYPSPLLNPECHDCADHVCAPSIASVRHHPVPGSSEDPTWLRHSPCSQNTDKKLFLRSVDGINAVICCHFKGAPVPRRVLSRY